MVGAGHREHAREVESDGHGDEAAVGAPVERVDGADVDERDAEGVEQLARRAPSDEPFALGHALVACESRNC
jgi:hypothetical protein